ncbi:MAG: hypothetical protein LBE24_02720 [Methylobacillus sp.]|jgi:hypothetical protein|nr:hypothetical protein [Methylobacillus sp.]
MKTSTKVIAFALTGAVVALIYFVYLDKQHDQPTAEQHDKDFKTALETSEAHSKELVCGSDFKDFAEVFTHSKAQAEYTQWPLQVTSIVDINSEPEPKPVTKWLGEQEMSMPLLVESPESIKEQGYEASIEQDDATSGHIMYRSPESDMLQIRYNFKRVDSCWQLVEIDDQSL